jgi:hypothetical protein
MVTAPLVGEAPIALKSVVVFKGVAALNQLTFVTGTQVSPLPERVGVPGGVVPIVLVTQARMRVFAAGAMDAVVYEVAFVVLPLLVSSVAVTAAAMAVPGRRIRQ